MFRRSSLPRRISKHLIIWVFIALVFFPIAWIFSASLNPANTLIGQELIPPNANWDHFVNLFTNPRHPFGRWLLNSVKISGITAILTVAMGALAAYAFSRFRFRGRRTGLVTMLLVQMFPSMMAMVALFLFLQRIGGLVPWAGLNTHAGLILIYLGGALGFNAWLMKGYFDTIPRSLEESALIDGATPFQAFIWIILPLVRPILAVIAILTFIGTYGDFLLPSILLTGTEQYTFAVGLRLFIVGEFDTRWGIFAAAALLGALPIVIIFLLLQDFIVSGLTRGAVKG
ncbi:maltose ABC transporter permease MalG [Candidatus Acetothermia bacterium]|jgi:ABC-type maltose transport system permease subunit|nr:maltose ABC transporter permease MalG [Candidatus Acetothermia bacterium]MCI2427523.1 maltose ABC transporter permease MalG [Candidatus Acetothermia bacterium]MCI2427985.1 maltose ABC transporter permease MalG [Candidatus Acetothermia bacterium]